MRVWIVLCSLIVAVMGGAVIAEMNSETTVVRVAP